jgi:23S rRNA (cytidine1920-2'-O)/16S rRNA (cytidine1409-2'-O)-methyltransferase
LKLQAALDTFSLPVEQRICADLGCNVGGFTDCLLKRGAQRVYAVDTAYGQLAWTLRNDPRVTVLERTNALHFDPATLDPPPACDLVTIDLGWTRQSLAVPASLPTTTPSRGSL